MGRSAALKEPSFFDSAVTVRLVAASRILTVAFCTTAPLASVTVPLSEPSVCWPIARCGTSAKVRSAARTNLKIVEGRRATDRRQEYMRQASCNWATAFIAQECYIAVKNRGRSLWKTEQHNQGQGH